MQTSRRRFIRIAAASATLPLFSMAALADPSLLKGELTPRHWRGIALGADASLTIYHPDVGMADYLIVQAVAEMRRLEAAFSLYQVSSEISRLNQAGILPNPSIDLLRLLTDSVKFSRLTAGVFDVTVQPLWRLYADHFAKPDADPAGPDDAARRAACAFVGHDNLVVDEAAVRFVRSGMGLTLNGIGQGYVTDRVVDLLLAAGIDNALVDMGEARAMGRPASGDLWQVGIKDPLAPERLIETLSIGNSAISTSGGYGLRFGPQGLCNHLIDPRSGLSAQLYGSVSVICPTATMADALSTAFSLMPLDDTQKIVELLDIEARFVTINGQIVVQRAT